MSAPPYTTELALTGGQRRRPTHQAVAVGAQLLQQIGISAPKVGKSRIVRKGAKQRHRSELYMSVNCRLRAFRDASHSRPSSSSVPELRIDD
ncbi:MAG: hypothetical protein AUI16_10400 [Alphaproteobacteria bacterium 13_2_20CM_2_64_7]|nr:MAG: hypothetical protein AUI16_10400 [Alphaproteobacteria bacterium 13_2_20CM_2_64_7]